MSKNHAKKSSKALIVILIIVFILIAGLSFAWISLTGAVDASSTELERFTVESGSGTHTIAANLAQDGFIKSETGFKLYSRIRGLDTEYKAGTYHLSKSMTMPEIAAVITGGQVASTNVTITEGLTEYEVASLLAAQDLVNEETFIQVLENTDFSSEYSFLQYAQTGPRRLEGYLFPDTYQIPDGATEEDIIRMMLDNFEKVYEDGYTKRAQELGYSNNEILVIASIIEKESGNQEDRTKVASVIYNRLNIGMPLQMDSTIAYTLKINGKDASHPTTYADLEEESEYNTYQNTGVPPGPICSPSKASIEAALNPDTTDYIYFVLNPELDGSSYFTSDYSDFLAASERYYEAVRNQEKN